MIDIYERLAELKKEQDERSPNGWDDYEWCTGRGDFVEGQISLLEEMIK